jgi:hypothetical protein
MQTNYCLVFTPKSSRSRSAGFRGKWYATFIGSYYVFCDLKFNLYSLAVEYSTGARSLALASRGGMKVNSCF